MPLTDAPRDGDDLATALAERFGAPAPAGVESRPAAPEGDTFLPGDTNEAEKIASRLEALKKQAAALQKLVKPPASEAKPGPAEPPVPVVDAATLPAAPPPADIPPPPTPVPPPMRFGPTTAPPPPAPMGLAMPTVEEASAPEASAACIPDAATEPPKTEHDSDDLIVESQSGKDPAGKVTVKKSSAKKPDKRSRKLFGRGGSDDAAASPSRPPLRAAAEPAATLPGAQEEGGPRHKGTPLGELLIGRGLVSEEQLREALTTQTGSGKRLGNILVELGLLSERALVEVLAEQLQLDIIDMGRMDLDREVATLLTEHDARRLAAVPVRRDGAWLEVAVADPLSENLREQLIELLSSPVRLLFATKTDIDAVINRMYVPDVDLGDALRMFEARLEQRKSTKENEATVTTVVDENAPVVKVVNLILEQAVRERASDIHIEPMEEVVRVRARTDGALHEIMTLPGPMGPSLISRIKVMSEMNIVERRKPQDGQLAIAVAGRGLDVRVSTTPTVFGEKCVLRVLDKTKAVIDLPGLGMAPDTYSRYSELIRSPYGMVICAGPTGSGKTTTLYATLTAINNDDINVVTVEDPVEYVFPTINQMQVNEAGGLTFASALRSILRQDPDAILVGEIRDVETARIAVQAALTGHFVMSSLHATDATSALHRFMDMGIEPFLVASSLLGVVGQRLVRKVCPHCITGHTPTPDELSFYERSGGDTSKAEFVYGAGCTFCGNTGYYDRVGIYEVLGITDEFKELIVQNAPHAELRKLAMQQGMRTLREQAIQLVTQDKTTIAEVLRTVYVL